MIEYIICLIALIIGSITDLKTREVPDYLNFALIAIGFGMAILAAILNKDITYLSTSAIGFALCFIFSIIMYYTGQWGGGDAKMLMGIGSVIGVSYTSLHSLEMPFLLLFLIMTFFIGGIYGIVWLSIVMIKNFDSFKRTYKTTYNQSSKYLRYVLYFSVPILIIGALTIEELFLKATFTVLSIMLILLFYLFIAIKVLEEIAFIKEIPLSKLTEGDWIAEPIVLKGDGVIGNKDSSVTKEQVMEFNKAKTIVRRICLKIRFWYQHVTDNIGITREQLTKLHEAKIKVVKVKYGIPFVPSFLLAFIAAIIIWLR